MQSGIRVSAELRQTWDRLRSDTSSNSPRGLIIGIERDEELVPRNQIPSTYPDDFYADLAHLEPLLLDNATAYVLLRRYASTSGDESKRWVCVTYVPDPAPVRSKMLFASTELTLLRELGGQHFAEHFIATSKDEFTAAAWHKHEAHVAEAAPLTEEEQALRGVKEAEASASQGTGARSSHVSSGMRMPLQDDARQALQALAKQDGSDINMVQLRIDVPRELIQLASTESSNATSLARSISTAEPRYTFYRHQHPSGSAIAFIYTCPAGAKLKERMVYASSRAHVLDLAQTEAGMQISKKLEASDPSEVTAEVIDDEFNPKREEATSFARPKRPGRR